MRKPLERERETERECLKSPLLPEHREGKEGWLGLPRRGGHFRSGNSNRNSSDASLEKLVILTNIGTEELNFQGIFCASSSVGAES